MKNKYNFPFKKRTFFGIFLFACMLVFANLPIESLQKIKEFRKDLTNKLIRKNIDNVGGNSNSDINESLVDKKSALESNENKNVPPQIISGANPKLPEENNDHVSSSNIVYSSKEKQGIIGTLSDKEEDRISDNFFTIDIPAIKKENSKVYLEYDLFGLATHQSVPRSINHNIAIGGEIIIPSAQWSHQKEEIGIDFIKNGLNTILFTSPADGVKYKIKDLKLVFERDKETNNSLIVSSVLSDNKLYVKGNNILSKEININNESINVRNGEFEKVFQLSEKDKLTKNFSVTSNGITQSYKIPADTKSFKVSNNNYFQFKRNINFKRWRI